MLARCKDCEHGTYDAASSTCACEGNFMGPFCETECDCSGDLASIEDARAGGTCAAGNCTCEGSSFIGEFCQTKCDCSGNGNQTAIEPAREANSCYAGSCACERGALGELCETYSPPIDLSTVPAQCAAGMGSHGVVYNGAAYRTLDDAPPEGGSYGAPNRGCQCTGGTGSCDGDMVTDRAPIAPGEKWGFSKRKWGLKGGGK